MSDLFRTRPANAAEFESLRLILSTFTDGSGQQILKDGSSRPGWRDFERAVASLVGGTTAENKGVFDVVVPRQLGIPFGLSCKTSAVSSLSAAAVLFELHNSNAKAWARLDELGIDPTVRPKDAGAALIRQVREWHEEVEGIDIASSSYVVLIHNKPSWTRWKVLWYPLELDAVNPTDLSWSFTGRRIEARTGTGHRLWEWYGWSGGQLKYYPLVTDALWSSDWFSLETAPPEDLAVKAGRYFPEVWGDPEPCA